MVEVFTELQGPKIDEFDGKISAGHPVGAPVDDTEGTTADFFVQDVQSVGRMGREGREDGWYVENAMKESEATAGSAISAPGKRPDMQNKAVAKPRHLPSGQCSQIHRETLGPRTFTGATVATHNEVVSVICSVPHLKKHLISPPLYTC